MSTPLLTLDNVSLAFGDSPLLHQAQAAFQPGERIALIGRNGTGKSTLLNVLLGSQAPDDGVVWRAQNVVVGFVEQEPVFPPDQTAFDAVASGLKDHAQALIAWHQCADRLAIDPQHPETVEALAHWSQILDANGGWASTHRVEQAISALGLDPNAKCGDLSGGTIKRVALARALANEPDLLLLDEPTNHLDIDGIQWLESRLREFRGTVITVTHDRRFLDAIATRILELDRGQLQSFPAPFASYEARKEEALNAETLANARADKLLAQEEVWIRQGVEARRTRAVGRVQRLEQLRLQRAERRERSGQVKLLLSKGESSGKVVSALENVNKSFDQKQVIREVELTIVRGDRVGFIGPNGAGKTTLLKLILGELSPDSGTVRVGTRLNVAYFDQFRSQLDPNATLADVISPGSDYVEIGGQRIHVIGYLENFLFSPRRVRQPVSALSGGERARLLLARLFARPSNVIVLDEPTNDLDVETLELLEARLLSYDGTVLLVSHDRAFLDAVVTQTVAYEGEGRWKEYVGGFEDWSRQTGRAGFAKPPAKAALNSNTAAPPPSTIQASVPASPGKKLSYKEQQELAQLPAKLTRLEEEQEALNQRLMDGSIWRDNPSDARRSELRLAEIDSEITAALERWENLEARSS